MAAGTPKIARLGGIALTPGGTQTFNASGTFTAPVGITKVNLNMRGGSGNPGNPGNPGCPGGGGNGGFGSGLTHAGNGTGLDLGVRHSF